YAQFVESVLSPRLPFVEDVNTCPREDCTGILRAMPIPGEAYQRPKVGHSVPNTTECNTCDQKFAHKAVIEQRVRKFALENNIDISPSALDNFRCSPPSESFEQTPSDLCLFVMNLLEFQFHHATHTSTNLQESALDPETCIMKSFRPLGLEYYNLCNLYWARLSMDNMDIQFLINSSTRKSTAYTIKYTFKRQSLESSAIMRIGLYTQNVASVISRPDNDVITPPERSLRIINKFLYSLTKPVEVCTTMAAYLILSDGALFESSHQFVYRSLSLLNACYPDVPDPVQDQSTDKFVDLSIPLSSINSDSVDLCPMDMYWTRPAAMAQISFIDCIEQYHIVKGKGNTGNHWVQNAFLERKVLIVLFSLL
ncbi:hypothetical protein HDU78_000370, partial [Chytriomyces hyalinus]